MPSSVTHGFFCNDVFDKLDENIQKKISPSFNEFKVFSQGPDPYFFYDFHLTKKSREINKINKAMQHTLINKHFFTLINYINDKKYYSNSLVMSYLYGQICHFALDSTCHPYIIYNTGLYNPKSKETYKYNGLHEKMEYYIDCYLIWKRKQILPKKYKPHKELFCKMAFNSELKDILDNVAYSVYGFSDVSEKYLKSIKDMKKFYNIFNYDRLGIKKVIYTIMDLICPKSMVKKRELSFNIDPYSCFFYLNTEKDTWCHPCNNKEIYDYSFMELYNMSINIAVEIITAVNNMLELRKVDKKKIFDLFGNKDYGTGKDAELKLKYKYFKF